jgi:nicotinamidase-related amidase
MTTSDSRDGKPRTSALLVIDVQNANTAGAWQQAEVVDRIRQLIDKAKAADAPVLWVQHEEGEPFAPGSDGWQIVDKVRPKAGETVIAKHYLDSFADTTLRKELDALGVGHLVICGAATDACIRATSARALIEGYDTTLVGDAHTTDEGPWDLPLPDGRTVPVGAETMIAYTNFFVADTVYPGITTAVVNHDEVEFRV